MATIYTTESVLSMEEAAELDSDGYSPVRSPMVRSTKAMVSRREKRDLKIVRDTDLLKSYSEHIEPFDSIRGGYCVGNHSPGCRVR